MARKYQILLLDDQCDLHHVGNLPLNDYQAIFCLFWTAPSTKAKLQAGKGLIVFGLQDIISTEMAWGERAHNIAQKIIDAGLNYNKLSVRSYLAEPLYKECHLPCLFDKMIGVAGHLRDQNKCDQVVFAGYLKKTHCDLLRRKLSNEQGYLFHETLPREPSVSSSPGGSHVVSSTWLQHLRKIWAIRGWRTHAMHLLERGDKTYRFRCSVGPFIPRSAITRGSITFFSSYLNNSRMLSPFVDLMPAPITWIVTNVWARKGIADNPDKAFWIWQFSRDATSDRPGRDTLPLIKFAEDTPDYLYMAGTDMWKNWQQIECSLLMNLTKCWEAYLDEAEPRLIVTASQWGIEGWFAQCAKQRGIPVLQVMHGVLGGYLYTQTPITSDALIVPGEFWKNLWTEDQRDKILTFNPHDSFPKRERPSKTRSGTITYFSWPLSIIPFYNFSEIMDALLKILHHLVSEADIQILVRPHPLEDPLDFLGRWRYLYGPLPANIKIDGNSSLQETIAQTDLALMFRSTLMLNCFAQTIPVVMPGWIDYGWSAGLTEIPGMYLAKDFADLEEKIQSWLRHPPDISGMDVHKLVSPPGDGQDKLIHFLKGC